MLTDCGAYIWKKPHNKHPVPSLPLQLADNIDPTTTDLVIMLKQRNNGMFKFVWCWIGAVEMNVPLLTNSAKLLHIHPLALGGIL